jgi:hypothetical protein
MIRMTSIKAELPRLIERQYFAVRCCCQPTKLIGFLLLPKEGGLHRIVRDERGASHRIEIKSMMEYGCGDLLDTFIGQEMAVYSEDRGEDFWVTIPGFVRIITADFVINMAKHLSGTE